MSSVHVVRTLGDAESIRDIPAEDVAELIRGCGSTFVGLPDHGGPGVVPREVGYQHFGVCHKDDGRPTDGLEPEKPSIEVDCPDDDVLALQASAVGRGVVASVSKSPLSDRVCGEDPFDDFTSVGGNGVR